MTQLCLYLKLTVLTRSSKLDSHFLKTISLPFDPSHNAKKLEACVAEWLTPQTLKNYLKVWGFKSRPSCCFLTQGALLHFVSLHPAV